MELQVFFSQRNVAWQHVGALGLAAKSAQGQPMPQLRYAS